MPKYKFLITSCIHWIYLFHFFLLLFLVFFFALLAFAALAPIKLISLFSPLLNILLVFLCTKTPGSFLASLNNLEGFNSTTLPFFFTLKLAAAVLNAFLFPIAFAPFLVLNFPIATHFPQVPRHFHRPLASWINTCYK